MKYDDIQDVTLRSVLEGLDYGHLFVDIPNDGNQAYGFIRVKLHENLSVIMVCDKYLGRADSPDNRSCMSLITDILDNKESGRFYSTFFINERSGDLLVNVHSGIGHGFFHEYFGDPSLDAMGKHELIAALSEDAHELTGSTEEAIFNAVTAHLIDATEHAMPKPEEEWFNAHGRPCGEYASMASAFIEGRAFDIETECAIIARSKVHEETIESLSLGRAFVSPGGIIDRITNKVLSKTVSIRVDDEFESVLWSGDVAKTVVSEAAMFDAIRENPTSDQLARRDLFAALTKAFPSESDNKPKTVKVTIDSIETDSALTVEYGPLICSLYACDSTIYESSFAAKDRNHLKGSVSPADISSVVYRGKTIYQKLS